jgi:hypothetical protein
MKMKDLYEILERPSGGPVNNPTHDEERISCGTFNDMTRILIRLRRLYPGNYRLNGPINTTGNGEAK